MSDAAGIPRRCKTVGVKVLRKAAAVFAREESLAAQPASDEQLVRIWPPWNCLPADMLPEARHWILTGELVDRMPTGRETFNRLRGQFPFLPLNQHEFKQSLARAVKWSSLVNASRTTFQLHLEFVKEQLSFPNFDDVNTGRVAIYRVTNELDITHPGLLQNKAPTLADIELLQQRYDDYFRARTDATRLLMPLVFSHSLDAESELPFREHAVGLPQPPDNFPQHLHIARLAAFGKCSERRLADFFHDSFLKLSRQQMNEFCDEFHNPTPWRRGKYVLLGVWLADNAPVFRAFKTKWKEILEAAQTRFNGTAPEGYRDCPREIDDLKAYWKEREVHCRLNEPRRISPPTGRPRLNSKRLDWQPLLTPFPFVPGRKG